MSLNWKSKIDCLKQVSFWLGVMAKG